MAGQGSGSLGMELLRVHGGTHAQAGYICKSSEETGREVTFVSCFVEAFPEREPNSGQLPMDQSHLRVDIVWLSTRCLIATVCLELWPDF